MQPKTGQSGDEQLGHDRPEKIHLRYARVNASLLSFVECGKERDSNTAGTVKFGLILIKAPYKEGLYIRVGSFRRFLEEDTIPTVSACNVVMDVC
jgi:hypothetical protein